MTSQTTGTAPIFDELSPIVMARIAGVLYLCVIAGGLFAEIGVRQQLIVIGDAEATAQNILANEGLFRAGLGVNIAYLLGNVPFAVLFHHLFKSASALIAQIMVLGIVLTTAIEAANLFNYLAAMDMIFMEGAAALTADVRHELAYASLRAFTDGFGLSLIFFGVVCLTYGWLILKSRLLPRVIGGLISLAGVCYLINSFAMFLAPDFAASLFPAILLPSFIGELSLASWLTIKSVKSPNA